MASIEQLLFDHPLTHVDGISYVQQQGPVELDIDGSLLNELALASLGFSPYIEIIEPNNKGKSKGSGGGTLIDTSPPSFTVTMGRCGTPKSTHLGAVYEGMPDDEIDMLIQMGRTAGDYLAAVYDTVYESLAAEGIPKADVTAAVVSGVEPVTSWGSGGGMVLTPHSDYGMFTFYQAAGGMTTLTAETLVPIGKIDYAYPHGGVTEDTARLQHITDTLPLIRSTTPFRGPTESEIFAALQTFDPANEKMAADGPPVNAWAYVQGSVRIQRGI